MSPTPSPTNNQPPIHPIISMKNWKMRMFQVAILRSCLLGSHLCHGVIFLIILVLAGLGEAADAMVELCVLWYQYIEIKVGTSMSCKFLWYDPGNIRTIAASDSHTNSSIYKGTGMSYFRQCKNTIPKLVLEIQDISLLGLLLSPRLDDTNLYTLIWCKGYVICHRSEIIY